MPTFEINNATDLYLTGDIGFEISAKRFISDLKDVQTPNITVHIDSLGGSVFEGISIYNALQDFKGFKTAVVEGVCFSAASYILMAFDKIKAKSNALIMLHNPLVENISGNAEKLTHTVKALNELTDIYIKAYAEKAKKSPEYIQQLLNAETYLNAVDAVKEGFVDEIIGEANNISTEALKAAFQNRLVAYETHFNKSKNHLPTMDDNKPIKENPTEEVKAEVVENEKVSYTVDEALAVLETAKEANTKEAFELALETISKAIEAIEDKAPFEEILKELQSLIENTSDEKQAEEVVAEVKSEEKEVPEKSDLEKEQERKNAILDFAKELNKDSALDKLIISALSTDMTLDDFKTEACKTLSVARARNDFKAMLFGKSKQATTSENTTLHFRTKGEYIAHYNALVDANKKAEATAFFRKYKHIF